MGLPAMMVHTWEGRMRFGQDDNFSDPFAVWKQARNDRFAPIKPLWYAILAGLFAWTIWALRSTKLLVGRAPP